LQGHVVCNHANEVIVDFGYKLEGLVPIEQLQPTAPSP
jgi:ribosomal protein S1